MDDWFNEFWQTYPADLSHKKKGSKSEAYKYILKLKPDEDLRKKILINLRELMRHCRQELKVTGKTDRWPFATTWLRREAWNDLEDVTSSMEMQERSVLCGCGQPVQINKYCWSCFEKKQPTDWREHLIKLAQTEGTTIALERLHHKYRNLSRRDLRPGSFSNERTSVGSLLRGRA